MSDHPIDDPNLSIWTIYRDPSDHPGKYVVRRWEVTAGAGAKPTNEVAACDSLLDARARVPQFSTFLPRSPEDDPCIVESWI